MPASAPSSRLPLILAGLSLAISLVALGWVALRPATTPTSAGSRLLSELNREKVLRIGVVENPPQATYDPTTGQHSGYHVDVLIEIAKRLDARTEFEKVTFADMQLALEGRVQVVAGGGFVSVERAANFGFTDPLFHVGLSYVCAADAPFATEADLKRPGLRVAYAAGTQSEEYVQAHLPQAQRVVLARGELAKIPLEVTSGRADVGLANMAACARFEKEIPGLKNPTRLTPFALFESCLTVRKDEPDALNFLNASIRTLRLDGTLARLEEKYNNDKTNWIPLKP